MRDDTHHEASKEIGDQRTPRKRGIPLQEYVQSESRHRPQATADGDEEAAAQYADLARAVITGIWPLVIEQFCAKHGTPPGRGAVVLGMGSLGASRLNAGSDLDLIVIYDAEAVEASDGRRPLAARPYYARLTQAMITALTAPMAEGRLYEVDMRLRPSGQ